MKRVVIIVLLLSCFYVNCRSQKFIKTGIYSGYLFLGYEPSLDKISGYLSYSPYESVSDAIQIDCDFFFIGQRSKNNTFNLLIYESDDSLVKKGTLIFKNDKIYLKFLDEIPSCQAIIDFDSEGYADFYLSDSKEFKMFGMVLSSKERIYKSDTSAVPTNKYFIRGDVVKILKVSNNGKVYVEFEGKKVTRGWIYKKNVIMP